MSGWTTEVHPDCASRNRPHPYHQLAGPGGAKPGDYCGGVKADDDDDAEVSDE